MKKYKNDNNLSIKLFIWITIANTYIHLNNCYKNYMTLCVNITLKVKVALECITAKTVAQEEY